MEDQVKVLNLWVSPFGLRVLAGLEEKGVKYEYQEENMASKSDLLLKMNPIHKKIPVLIHNDKPDYKSLIIVEYIDEACPNTNLFMPSTTYGKSMARFWEDFVDKKIYDNGGALIMKLKGESQEEAKCNRLEYLGLLQGSLDELSRGIKPYFGGEKFGYMDISFIPFASWFHAREVMSNWNIPLETQFPSLHEWVNACMERECVKKVLSHPEKVPEFATKLR